MQSGESSTPLLGNSKAPFPSSFPVGLAPVTFKFHFLPALSFDQILTTSVLLYQATSSSPTPIHPASHPSIHLLAPPAIQSSTYQCIHSAVSIDCAVIIPHLAVFKLSLKASFFHSFQPQMPSPYHISATQGLTDHKEANR